MGARFRMRGLAWSLLPWGMLVVSGCSAPRVVRGYSGEVKPEQDVALVLVDGSVNVYSDNGVRLWGGRFVELTPGKHTLQVHNFKAVTNDATAKPAELEVDVLPGRTYQLGSEDSAHGLATRRWKPIFTEVSDATARGEWAKRRVQAQDTPPCTPEEYFGPDSAPKKWPECPPR